MRSQTFVAGLWHGLWRHLRRANLWLAAHPLLRACVVVAVVIGALIGTLRWRFHGPQLGGIIEDIVNQKVRGEMKIGSVKWPMSAIGTAITGGWIPATLENVEVWDDQVPRKLVAKAALVTAEIDIHALMLPPHNFIFRHVKTSGGYALIEEVDEPYPLHEFDSSTYSILSAFYGDQKPGFRVGINGRSGMIWDVQDFSIRDFTVEMRIARDNDGFLFTTRATDVDADGFIYYDGADPLLSKMYFSLAPTAGPSVVRIFDYGEKADYEMALESVSLPRLAQLPHNWPQSAAANSLEVTIRGRTAVPPLPDGTPQTGADIELTGQMRDWWDRPYDGRWDLHVTATNLGPTLGAMIDPSIHGDAVTATMDLTGPYAALPRIDATLRGLYYDVFIDKNKPPIELELDTLAGYIDMVNYRGAVQKTIARGAGGELHLTADFGLSGRPYTSADFVITKPIDIGQYLPRDVQRTIGGKLGGRFHIRLGKRAEGDDERIPEESIQVDNIAVTLGSLGLSGGHIISEMRFRYDVEKSQVETVQINDIVLSHKGTRARIDGTLGVAANTVDVKVAANSDNLTPLLKTFGLPGVARTGTASASISGKLDDPTVDASVAVAGVPAIGEISTQLAYRQGRMRVASLTAPRLPQTKVSADLQLFPRRYLHSAEIRTNDVSLDGLPDDSIIHGGRISAVALTASGPPDKLTFRGFGVARDLQIGEEQIARLGICVNSNDPARCRSFLAPAVHEEFDKCTARFGAGGQCIASHVAFADANDTSAGARIDAVLHTTKQKSLGGVLATTRLPIRILTGLAGQPNDVVGGDLNMALTLAGMANKPVAAGTLDIGRFWLLGAALGDASFEVNVSADGKLVVKGQLLDGRLALSTTLSTKAPYEMRTELRFARLDLDTFLPPSMAAQLPMPVRMWGTGTAVVQANLGDDTQPHLQVDFDEVRAIADFFDAEGRPAPLDLHSMSPFSLVADATSVAVMCHSIAVPTQLEPCQAQLVTPAGPLSIGGTFGEKSIDLKLAGRVDAALLRPFLASQVDAAGGYADLTASVTGTPAMPHFDGQLALDNAWLELAKQDTTIRLPSGVIAIRQDSLGVTGVKLIVEDEYTGDTSELSLLGNVMLKDYHPARWALDIEGEISGPVLVALAPETLSQASGIAKVSATLYGEGELPALFGQIEFDPRRPLAITPRSARSQLVMESGMIQVSDNYDTSVDDACDLGTRQGAARSQRIYRVGLCRVSGSFDNEGLIRNITGILDVTAEGVAAADIAVQADAIPFRVPRTLDLVINANMRFLLDESSPAWDISGKVEMVSGKYIRDFEFGELISPAKSGEPATPPVWETSPSLGASRLNVTVDVRRFSIANNLANIDMDGQVIVGGSPRAPQLSGQISVQRGTFRLPATQATFTRTSGAVQFSPVEAFPVRTPTVRIQTEADYRDASGQDHLITFVMQGPMSGLTWDLFTSTGFNKGQAMQLLAFGRTPDQFRRSIDGTTQTQAATDPSTNPSESFTDQLIKDASGDVVALFIEDPIRSFVKLDVARPVIGAGSVGFHGEKKFTDNVNVVGDWSTSSTSQNFNIRGEVRSPYRVNLQVGYLSRRYDDATTEDVKNFELKLVYSLPLF